MTSIFWKRLKRTTYPMLALVLELYQASAQDVPARLTAGEAVASALSNNHSLKIASLEEKSAGARFKETDAVFLPQAGISYFALTTNNPLHAFGFRLQQKTIGAEDFNPTRLNHPGSTPDFMTTFDVQQPLLNMDLVYQRKGARAEMDIYRLKGQRTREEIVFGTRKAYMQLQLAYRAQKVMENALGTALALRRYTEDRVQQGMLSQADALNIQVQVRTTESDLAQARSQVRNASDYLSLLMGRTPGPVYSVDTTSAENTISAPPDSILSEERADLLALGKSIEASDLMLRSSRMSALPRLNAFGSYQLNDSRMLGFGVGAYLAGIRLSWDLFKGNSIRNKNATLQLQKDKLTEEYSLYKERSIVELNTTRRQLDDAAFRIIRQQASVASAAESYRILKDRYEQGLSGSTDVLLAQTQLSRQQLALSQAIFDRDVTNAYIEFLTSSSGK